MYNCIKDIVNILRAFIEWCSLHIHKLNGSAQTVPFNIEQWNGFYMVDSINSTNLNSFRFVRVFVRFQLICSRESHSQTRDFFSYYTRKI